MFLDIITPSTKIINVGKDKLSNNLFLDNVIFQVFLIAVLLILLSLILFFVLKKNRKVNN